MRRRVVAMGAWRRGHGDFFGIARRSEAQCSIGFQPVSGPAARHPRKSVGHATGTIRQASTTWTKKQAGSLFYFVLTMGSFPNRGTSLVGDLVNDR
jgi:hypothetical protein